jgi:hypothetical protein
MRTIKTLVENNNNNKSRPNSSFDGLSPNVRSSTVGTNLSKSLFDGISNLSNLEELDLIEQSKIADQKITLL